MSKGISEARRRVQEDAALVLRALKKKYDEVKAYQEWTRGDSRTTQEKKYTEFEEAILQIGEPFFDYNEKLVDGIIGVTTGGSGAQMTAAPEPGSPAYLAEQRAREREREQGRVAEWNQARFEYQMFALSFQWLPSPGGRAGATGLGPIFGKPVPFPYQKTRGRQEAHLPKPGTLQPVTNNIQDLAHLQWAEILQKTNPCSTSSTGKGSDNPPTILIYRKMSIVEAAKALDTKKLQPKIPGTSQNGKKYLSDSLDKVEKFENNGVPGEADEVIIEFTMDKAKYDKIMSDKIHQDMASQTPGGKAKAEFHCEILYPNGPYINLGITPKQLPGFNEAITGVKILPPKK